MPSGGWKLSAAMIAASLTLTSIAEADENRFLATAMKCTRIAALSFANQEQETSVAIAMAAVRSCRAPINLAAKDKLNELRSKGSSLTQQDAQDILTRGITTSTEGFVIEMRSIAKQRGPGFYAEAAARIANGS